MHSNKESEDILMGRYFGTDGFRGKAGVGLTADHAYQIGRFLGYYYGRGHRATIVVGKDTRRSSYVLEYAISAGMAASGADVHLLHVTTTPSVSYMARTYHYDCGVMISASHNPFYDNGIKLINGDGEKMDEGVISLVEDYLDGKLMLDGEILEQLPMASGDAIGCIIDDVAGRDHYAQHLISLVQHSFQGKRVALDCANGSASAIAKNVFDALGAETHVIHNDPNGLNINENCGSTHIEELQKFVLQEKCDVGFAYDGDADRCLCVDEKGHVVDGEAILYIYGRYMKERGKLTNNTIVTTVMSNFGLYKALDELGIGYELHEAPYDEADLSATAMARSLGVPVEEVFKTLVVRGDKTGVLEVCVPGAAELNLKELAAVSGNKHVEMVPLKEVQPLTGYIRGGCSPLAGKKHYPVFVDESAILHERIYVSAGHRGVQLRLAPDDLLRAVEGTYAAIARY